MNTHHPSAVLLDKIRALRPKLKEAAPESERQRRVSPELIAELAEMGAFRMLVPRELGGGEVTPWVFLQALEEIAQGDAAAAWCVMTGATTGVLSAYMNEEGAQQLWGEHPDVVMAGIFAPMGKAIPVDGGYQLTGRWPFASGCENSSWRMGGALVMEDDKPRMGDDGAPVIYSMFFRSEDSEVIDTWSVNGLRGTGSHDIAVNNLFVPESHVTTLLGRSPRVQAPLFAFPVFGLLATGVAAVGLGIARAAIHTLVELAQSRRSFGGKKTMAQQELTQLQVAQSEADLQAARALFQTTLQDVWDIAEQTGKIGDTEKARVRMAAVHAATVSARVVDAMYHLGGGTSIYERCDLQRHFRDVHTMTQHIMVSPKIMTTVGRLQLGLPTNTAQL